MKNREIIVRQIPEVDGFEDLKKVSVIMDAIDDSHTIENTPWKEYPYKPAVSFKMAYTTQETFIKVFVKEKYIRAKYKQVNDPVYNDSCFEFFISFDEGIHYYNFEFNCIGTTYLAYGKPGGNREVAKAEIVKCIRTLSSLGRSTFSEKEGDFEWNLTIAIPFDALFRHDLKSLQGKSYHANFYKCGDELTIPHFLCWNKIETESPDFHRPEFFGIINFAKNLL